MPLHPDTHAPTAERPPAQPGLGNTTAERLAELGWPAPGTPSPAALPFAPAVRVGELVFTSGQIAVAEGAPRWSGYLGAEVSVAEAQLAAQHALVQGVYAAIELLGPGEDIESVVKLTGFIASAPGFTQQSAVLNPASDFLAALFESPHARSAIGVSELPFGAAVEVELVLRVRSH